MKYAKTLLDLIERMIELEKKVDVLEKQFNGNTREDCEEQLFVSKNESLPIHYSLASPKYRKFTDYLIASGESEIHLSFVQVEDILGFKLAPCARNHRANWANTTTISLPRSWLAAGYKTYNVDMENESVTFIKVDKLNYTI